MSAAKKLEADGDRLSFDETLASRDHHHHRPGHSSDDDDDDEDTDDFIDDIEAAEVVDASTTAAAGPGPGSSASGASTLPVTAVRTISVVDAETGGAIAAQQNTDGMAAAGSRLTPVQSARAEMMYNRHSGRKKALFSVILALCGILAPIATTGSLTAVPQIAATFHTSGSIINISNGLYTGAMGVSAFIWGITSFLFGRRAVLFPSVVTFFFFSLGSALAPNLAAFFLFRILSGFSGTGLLVCGPAVIGDLYRPTERATALAWIMSGTLIGPALGPLIGGIIVTYSSWRNVYWFQTGMAGIAAVLTLGFIPETAHQPKWNTLPRATRAAEALAAFNPMRMVVLFSRADLLLVALASSSLLWNMYAFMAPIVYVINPRLHFTTPLQSGLFYLAPGCGYLTGTFFGGRYADRTVKTWIRKRNGARRPADRLRAAVPWMGIGTPVCMLIYGWCLEYNRGGIPLLVVVMFIQGFTQLMIFPALNTFCLDIVPGRSTEVLGGNFFIRYLFGAAGTALSLPAYHAIGIGWLCTISTVFIWVAFLGMVLVIYDKVPRFGLRSRRTTPAQSKKASSKPAGAHEGRCKPGEAN